MLLLHLPLLLQAAKDAAVTRAGAADGAAAGAAAAHVTLHTFTAATASNNSVSLCTIADAPSPPSYWLVTTSTVTVLCKVQPTIDVGAKKTGVLCNHMQ